MRLGTALLAILLLAPQAPAQTRHAPARADEVGTAVPFEELLRRPARLRPGLEGKHPRVFFDAESLRLLRGRAPSSS